MARWLLLVGISISFLVDTAASGHILHNDRQDAIDSTLKELDTVQDSLVDLWSKLGGDHAGLPDDTKKAIHGVLKKMGNFQENLSGLKTTLSASSREDWAQNLNQDTDQITNPNKHIMDKTPFDFTRPSVDVEDLPPPPESCGGDFHYDSNKMLCYLPVDLWLDWYSAQQYCQTKGGQLIVLDDMNKFQQLKQDLRPGHEYDRYWVGLATDMDQQMRWTDGHEVASGMWNPGEPNHSGERCGELLASYWELNDNTCQKRYKFICESLSPSNTSNSLPPIIASKRQHPTPFNTRKDLMSYLDNRKAPSNQPNTGRKSLTSLFNRKKTSTPSVTSKGQPMTSSDTRREPMDSSSNRRQSLSYPDRSSQPETE